MAPSPQPRKRLHDPAPLRLSRRTGHISRSEVVRSMLPGSRRPRSRRELMSAFHADPRLAGIRADHRDNLVATMQLAARSATWADSDADPRATMRPTRARVAEGCDYSISTWKACRRQLETLGYARLVRPGRSEAARLQSEQPELHYEGNDAAVYVLAIPPIPRRLRPRKALPARPAATASPVTRPPTDGADAQGVNPLRRVDDGEGQEPRGTALRADSASKPAIWLALQELADVPKNLSDKAALREWRPFRARGWSMAEWLQAVRERPDGRRHPRRPSEVRYPWKWLKWRLSFWLDSDGKPLPPPSMQAAVRRERERRERELHRADQERRAGAGIIARTRAPGADPAPHVDELRERMGWPAKPPPASGAGPGPDAAG